MQDSMQRVQVTFMLQISTRGIHSYVGITRDNEWLGSYDAQRRTYMSKRFGVGLSSQATLGL